MRHSLWEQGAPEACNEWLLGYLDRDVRALKRRKADYDEQKPGATSNEFMGGR